jgi:hypothetical protein
MDYLTHHYKNLSEQLQAKVNHLQNLLEAYPGGMTPGRDEILYKATHPYHPAGREVASARADRANALRRRANATDRRRAAEDQARDEATVSSMPGFHDSAIAHFSTAFASKFGQNPKHAQDLALKVAADLHKAAGPGGFKNFAHASGTMHDYMQDSNLVRDHYEEQAILDPTKYGVHSDDIMDVDMSEEIGEDHADMAADVLDGLLKKKVF